MQESSHPIAVIVHLTGPTRGQTQRLWGEELQIGTAQSADIRLAVSGADLARAALLRRHGNTYQVKAMPAVAVWVNSEQVEELVLASGDVLEIGDRGEAFRFRIYPPDSKAYKSVLEAFSDCVECLRRSDEPPAARIGSLVSGMVGELRQISAMARILVSFVLLSFLGLVVGLVIQNQQLAQRLAQEESRLEGIAALLQRLEQTSFRRQDVADLREQIGGELERTRARLEALEAQNLAPARVIAEVAGSVVFIQASYGFRDGGGRWLRRAVAPPGGSIPPSGTPLTLEGSGPPAEIPYTGTGFLISREGYVFTNRHVAVPWDYDHPIDLKTDCVEITLSQVRSGIPS